MKFRVFSGRSEISFAARTCPISDDSVSIVATAAETLTCSFTEPNSSGKSASTRWLTPIESSADLA